GEYVPLGNVFPWLYTLTPMQAGLTSGTTPTVMTFNEIRFCPSICFENAVPHLVRKQLNTLRNDGNEPDCLITVTNDGWFWGSSLLDVHLACGVFRAIENRKPMLIAANTGFSAWIDSHGIVWSQGPRREEGIVYATVGRFRDEISFYRRIGDWPAFTMFLISVVSLISPRPRS
ncbi:MAG: hypothetical protein KDB27_13450, partial [Planctomycetales bacterium]|nr:hypothetical protein [Planctomycetales bacterium]